MDSVGLTVGILINLSDTSAGRVPRLSHSSRYSMYFLNGADLLAPDRALTMRTVNPAAASRPQMVCRSCSASMGTGMRVQSGISSTSDDLVKGDGFAGVEGGEQVNLPQIKAPM